MGMGRALLMRDLKQEEKSFQKKAKKKSLWGSIGRALGGLGAMALTGGAVNPLTVGLISGGASFLGGAIGAKASKTGDLSKGRFFKTDRESAQKELSAFGTQNLMSSLTSGLTAGVGQKLKLMKSGEEAAKLSEGFGMDFKGSFVGKGLEKRAIGKELMKAGEESIGESTGSSILFGEGEYGASADFPQYRSHAQFSPGEITSKIYDADPSLVPTKDLGRTVTATYGDRNLTNIGGEYFAEDRARVSAWDKFKDFVDVSDINKERAIESRLSQYRGNMSATGQPSWTPPGTGYKRLSNQLYEEHPGYRQSGLSNVVEKVIN